MRGQQRVALGEQQRVLGCEDSRAPGMGSSRRLARPTRSICSRYLTSTTSSSRRGPATKSTSPLRGRPPDVQPLGQDERFDQPLRGFVAAVERHADDVLDQRGVSALQSRGMLERDRVQQRVGEEHLLVAGEAVRLLSPTAPEVQPRTGSSRPRAARCSRAACGGSAAPLPRPSGTSISRAIRLQSVFEPSERITRSSSAWAAGTLAPRRCTSLTSESSTPA